MLNEDAGVITKLVLGILNIEIGRNTYQKNNSEKTKVEIYLLKFITIK